MLEANPTLKIQRFFKKGNDTVIQFLLNFSLALRIINFFVKVVVPILKRRLFKETECFC